MVNINFENSITFSTEKWYIKKIPKYLKEFFSQ